MAASDPKELEYEGYRQVAREATMDDMYSLAKSGLINREILYGMHLTAIDDAALDAVWMNAEFPWRRIAGQSRPFIRRFEVAIWMNNSLEGLCMCRSSRRSDNVTVHFIERTQDYCCLKGCIALIATDAADKYARIIGRRRVKLKNPVADVIPLYRELGFGLAENIMGSTYYARRVKP